MSITRFLRRTKASSLGSVSCAGHRDRHFGHGRRGAGKLWTRQKSTLGDRRRFQYRTAVTTSNSVSQMEQSSLAGTDQAFPKIHLKVRISLHEMRSTTMFWTGLNHETHQADDTEARHDFWSTSGNHIYRFHFQPRVVDVPKEGSLQKTISSTLML